MTTRIQYFSSYSDHFGAFTKETYDEEKKKKKQICVDHKIVMCEESVMAKKGGRELYTHRKTIKSLCTNCYHLFS